MIDEEDLIADDDDDLLQATIDISPTILKSPKESPKKENLLTTIFEEETVMSS